MRPVAGRDPRGTDRDIDRRTLHQAVLRGSTLVEAQGLGISAPARGAGQAKCKRIDISTSGMNYEAPLALDHRGVGPDRILFAVADPFEESGDPVRVMDGAPISDGHKQKIYHPDA